LNDLSGRKQSEFGIDNNNNNPEKRILKKVPYELVVKPPEQSPSTARSIGGIRSSNNW